jgi:spore coat polysaccharide biosynthesis predicted glycosyltransferase SpsG
MRVLLRCSRVRGDGAASLARSVAVGEALIERGHGALLSADLVGDWANDMVAEAGLDLLPGPAADHELHSLAEQQAVDLIHVDGDPEDLNALRGKGIRVSWVDEAAVDPGPADLVVNPRVQPHGDGDALPTELPSRPLVVSGPEYAPVRSSVREARERRQWRAGGMGDRLRVLVRLGDERAASSMLEIVRSLANSDVSVDVLAVAPSDALRMGAESLSTRLVRVLGTGRRSDLPRLLADHDLVVTRPGPILWELCCIGIPVALVGLTEDDERSAAAWVAADVAVSLGSLTAGARPAGQLRAMLRDGLRRAELGTNGLRLVDGGGADRIATLMERVVSAD